MVVYIHVHVSIAEGLSGGSGPGGSLGRCETWRQAPPSARRSGWIISFRFKFVQFLSKLRQLRFIVELKVIHVLLMLIHESTST